MQSSISIIEVSKKSTKFELCLCYIKQGQCPITDADISYEKSHLPCYFSQRKEFMRSCFCAKMNVCQEIKIIMRSTSGKIVWSEFILGVLLSPTKDSYQQCIKPTHSEYLSCIHYFSYKLFVLCENICT